MRMLDFWKLRLKKKVASSLLLLKLVITLSEGSKVTFYNAEFELHALGESPAPSAGDILGSEFFVPDLAMPNYVEAVTSSNTFAISPECI